jgi:hypothetical protein
VEWQRDTLATIERPTPNARRIERRRADRAEKAKNRKGECPPTEVRVQRGRKAGMNAGAGQSGGRPPSERARDAT